MGKHVVRVHNALPVQQQCFGLRQLQRLLLHLVSLQGCIQTCRHSISA